MKTKNHVLIVGVAALIIGFAGGYVIAGSMSTPASSTTPVGHGSTSFDMMANLQAKTGAEFERAFMDEMIVHHQSAIDMAELIPTRTTRPELLKLGNDIITAQTSEIQMMQQWKIQWSGE